MAALIKETITNSFADILYDKASDMMRVMRDELIDLDEPEIYNQFVRDMKMSLLAEDLGGNRRDMWAEVRQNRLGLLTHSDSERSEVTDEEAKSVCTFFFLTMYEFADLIVNSFWSSTEVTNSARE